METNNITYGLLVKEDIHLLKDIIEDDNHKFCPEYIKEYLETKGNIGFTAKLNGQVIGLIYCYSLLDLDGRLMMFMFSVGIHSNYQNRGYGSRLIKFAVDYSKAHEYAECFVNTNKSNTRACRVYEKAGMVGNSDDDIGYITIYDDDTTIQ